MRAFLGFWRYEFLMQLRRPSLWIGFVLTTPLLFAFRSATLGEHQDCFRVVDQGHTVCLHLRTIDVLGIWAAASMVLLQIVAGLVLADRVPRDRRLHVDELLSAQSAGYGVRYAGKYLGAVGATLIPMFVIYLAGVVFVYLRVHDPLVFALCVPIFLTVHVPAAFFIGAFTIACTTIIWPPLYQFLFVGYWLWNALNPTENIPTLSGTLLSPGGNWVLHGIFGVAQILSGEYAPGANISLALANLGVLALLAAVALCGGVAIARTQSAGR